MVDMFKNVPGGVLTLVIFLVVYCISCILLIKSFNLKKYMVFSGVMALLGIVSVVLLNSGISKSVKGKMRAAAYDEVNYYLSDEYSDLADTYIHTDVDKSEEMINNTIEALDYYNKKYTDGLDNYEQYARDHYDYKDYESLVKTPWYYSLITMFVTYGVLFGLIMLPLKIAYNKKLPQTKTVGLISALFGGTVIVWIVMMIWVNSLKPSNAPTAVSTASDGESSAADKINELKTLLDQGLITQQEFESKRQEILSKL